MIATGCARALDVGLRDEDASRREAGGDRGQQVSLRGGVVAGDEPDPPREAGEGTLALCREQTLCSKLSLEPLEGSEVLAEPEALDREGAQPEVAASLEKLRAAEDVDALAVRKVEPKRVELAAGHGHAQASTVRRVLERQEDALPAVLAAQLGHLALDPDGGQSCEPVADAAIERGHREHPAVAVLDRFDLHAPDATP